MAKAKKKKTTTTARPRVSAIPKGYHSITPVLVVKGAEQAIEFYKKAFGAKELNRAYMPGGNIIMHAEIQIGDSRIMLNDEFPEMNCKAPQSVGGASTALYVYVKDVEKIFTQAADSGAKVTMPLMDAFWGDRTGQLVDPFGHIWSFATRNRNLSQKEMQKAQQEWLAELGKDQWHETSIALSFGSKNQVSLSPPLCRNTTNNLIPMVKKSDHAIVEGSRLNTYRYILFVYYAIC